MKATWMYLLVVIATVVAILVLALCLIAGTHNPQAWAFALFGALVGGGSVHLCHHVARRQPWSGPEKANDYSMDSAELMPRRGWRE